MPACFIAPMGFCSSLTITIFLHLHVMDSSGAPKPCWKAPAGSVGGSYCPGCTLENCWGPSKVKISRWGSDACHALPSVSASSPQREQQVLSGRMLCRHRRECTDVSLENEWLKAAAHAELGTNRQHLACGSAGRFQDTVTIVVMKNSNQLVIF